MFSFQQFFPLLCVAMCILGWHDPVPLSNWKASLPYLIAFSLFCIGMTIGFRDWLKPMRKPEAVAFGIILQFIAAPLTGWLIVQGLSTNGDLALSEGILLTAIVSSSALAILMTFIAGGDTPLSLLISVLGAIWSALLMPWLATFLSNGTLTVEVDIFSVLVAIAFTQLIPIAIGSATAVYIPSLLKMLDSYLGDLIALTTLLVMGIAVSLGAQEVATLDLTLGLSSLLTCMLLLTIGFLAARFQGFTESESKSISFQTGIQNCGLSVSLIYGFANPAAAVVPATYLFMQSLASALLASYWRWQQQRRIQAALQSRRERMPLK